MSGINQWFALALLAGLATPAQAQSVAPNPTDSRLFVLTSTVPGYEVEFRVKGLGSGSLLTAAQVTVRSDTLYVTTPARLWIPKEGVGPEVRIEVQPGQPWLHAATEGLMDFDLWGGRLLINRDSGHPRLIVPVLRARPGLNR